MNTTAASLDPAEVAKFDAMAAEWWDAHGKFAPLHAMNPCRLDYITAQIAAEFGRDRSADRPFDGLRVLDIGCGGGLVAEPMSRLGADVTGIDASETTVGVAATHAAGQGLNIDYRQITAEDLAASGAQFDVVLALEIIEHVAQPQAFLTTCAALTRPGGLTILSTLNRTPKSFAAAILGAEWVMRWLPKGTHDWSKFITPEEMEAMMTTAALDPVDRKGMVFAPLSGTWSLSDRDLGINYIVTAVKPA